MRIYMLSPVGESIASNPAKNVTNGLRILYFLRRHGGQATEEQIEEFTGLSRSEIQLEMKKMTRGSNPIVRSISS